jgi:hypothetical protein
VDMHHSELQYRCLGVLHLRISGGGGIYSLVVRPSCLYYICCDAATAGLDSGRAARFSLRGLVVACFWAPGLNRCFMLKEPAGKRVTMMMMML